MQVLSKLFITNNTICIVCISFHFHILLCGLKYATNLELFERFIRTTNQLTCPLLHANKTIWILDKKYASSNVKLLAVVLSFCGFYCLIILLLKNQNCKKWHIIFTLKTPQTTIFEKTKFSCHLFQKICRPLLDFY